jgi:hypothetical protein
MVFLTKMDGYQKMCDTNKNVIKIGAIIKGFIVYGYWHLHTQHWFWHWVWALLNGCNIQTLIL